MQWVFLVLALGAALVELHTGTFYLAGAAAAALLTALTGFWIRGDLLIFVFVVLCAVLMAAIMSYHRRHRAQGNDLADFDIGKTVTIRSVLPQGNRLLVSYRGVDWEAVMEDGSVLAPGGTAIITRKSDKLLHLASPPETKQT